MPAYEYHCDDCESNFTVIATVAEHDKGLDVTCRICGSESVRRVFSGISVTSGKTGGGCTPGGGCCCG